MILNAGNRPLSIENIPLDDIEKAFENDDVGCLSNSQLAADAPPSKGYKKDVAPETPDFIGGFAVSTAEKTTSDFVDVKKILFPF